MMMLFLNTLSPDIFITSNMLLALPPEVSSISHTDKHLSLYHIPIFYSILKLKQVVFFR